MENARFNRLVNLFNGQGTSAGLRRSVGKQLCQLIQSDEESLLYPGVKAILPGLFASDPTQRSAVAYCLSLLDLETDSVNRKTTVKDIILELDLQKEYEEREVLLASRGSEYETGKGEKMDMKQQKAAVVSALSIAPGLDSFSEGIVEDKDFTVQSEDSVDSGLSVRQRAMLKRKNKQQEEGNRRARVEMVSLESITPTPNGGARELRRQVEGVLNSVLLHSNWCVRHGALLGIRALGGGCDYCLENLLILLALDSFVDFNAGDSASAPVREEASQLLHDYLKATGKGDLTRTVLDNFMFMLQTDASWNQNLTAYLVFSKCIPLLAKDENLDAKMVAECAVAIKRIIEEVDDDEMINNALALLQVITTDLNANEDEQQKVVQLEEGIRKKLLRMLPEFEDLSLAPAHIFTLLKGTCINVDMIVPFLRHKLSRVRLATVDYLHATLSQSVIHLSDYLTQQLFQVLLFEEEREIADKSLRILKEFMKEGDACWTRWIKILSVPIDKPLPLEHLYEFKLEESGQLQVIPRSVPEWELGVKAADIMLLTPKVLWERRRRAAQATRIPAEKCDGIRSALQKSNHGYHKVLAFWLGLSNDNSNSEITTLVECHDQPESVRELWALRLKAFSRQMSIEEYAMLLRLETINVLSEDFTRDCASMIDEHIELAKELLTDVPELGVLRRVCKNLKSPMGVYKVLEDDLVLLDLFLRALQVKPELSSEQVEGLLERSIEAQNHSLIGAMVQKHLVLERLLSIHFEDSCNFFLSLLTELVKMEEDEEVVALLPAFIPLTLKLMGEDERAAPLFASLLRLAPLVNTTNRGKVQVGLNFLKGLSDPASIVQDIKVPVQLGKVQLRNYQEEGFRWLIFLQQSGLHGALCDDMGLGKTLQTLCAIVHKNNTDNYNMNMKSLIICPSSLTGHWQREAATYFPHLKTALYIGKERKEVLARGDLDLLISSYDVIRNDIDMLREVRFTYAVLDEGHVIRNSKSKVSLAVRQLRAEHRLILTGTPIQNNVLELWTLFDFLMPGYLGRDQRNFVERYAKPIMAVSSTTSNSTVRDWEAAEEKLKVLHRQVLPFILRRMKEEVLKELPPKIVQDYYCEMSGEQKDAMKKLEGAFDDNEEKSNTSTAGGKGVLQAIHKMQLLSVHPGLVTADNVNQINYRESPKLLMLRDILIECGYDLGGEDEQQQQIGEGNRLLVFAQHRPVLDLVERMLKEDFGKLRYLRLDGQVPADQRAGLAHQFNQDPTYTLCLLTTSVGGLGLNLTGADTVVFLQHDWNPQRDLQAMDRAHRLGQRRMVNVYRLISRGSVEERVMGLQAWKIRVARTVVSEENTSITEMSRMSDITELLTNSTSTNNTINKTSDNDVGEKEVILGMSKWERMLMELTPNEDNNLE